LVSNDDPIRIAGSLVEIHNAERSGGHVCQNGLLLFSKFVRSKTVLNSGKKFNFFIIKKINF
jgi:diaminopimelate epimerase